MGEKRRDDRRPPKRSGVLSSGPARGGLGAGSARNLFTSALGRARESVLVLQYSKVSLVTRDGVKSNSGTCTVLKKYSFAWFPPPPPPCDFSVFTVANCFISWLEIALSGEYCNCSHLSSIQG